LKQLRDRELEYGDSFICDGGKEKCDRKCEIARIKIEGKIYPFGGACNRWYNLRSRVNVNAEKINLVAHYERLIFHKYIPSRERPGVPENSKTIGINKSFLVNTYFPLYCNFFSRLGFKVVLPDVLRSLTGISLIFWKKSRNTCFSLKLKGITWKIVPKGV